MKYLIGRLTKEWSVAYSEWRCYRKVAYITKDGDVICQHFEGRSEDDLELKIDHFIQAMRPSDDNS